MEGKAYYTALLTKYVEGHASPEETAELMEELDRNADTEEWQALIRDITLAATADTAYDPGQWEPVISQILHPVHQLRWWRRWIPYAAAAILVILAGTYLWNSLHKEEPSLVQTNPHPVQNDIAPGTIAPVLKLADGRVVSLDSAASGMLAQQGDAKVIRDAAGNIVYTAPLSQQELLYNTIEVPRGSRVVQIALADGTKVWLNAATTLKYPVAFVGKERKVEISGEAYFEVTKNASQPFRAVVHSPVTMRSTEIEVLGTHFEINAYGDESTLSTTLLEGSVNITQRDPSSAVIFSQRRLLPGQQATIRKGQPAIDIITVEDAQHSIAWVKGIFHFDRADMPSVMRQLSRWYNVEIRYTGNLAEEKITGDAERDIPLSSMLQKLQRMTSAHFTLQGQTVIVTP